MYKSQVSDCIIPIVRWQLRGDDDGLAPMSVLYYIEQDGSFRGIKVHKEEVIQYEQRAPFDSLEFFPNRLAALLVPGEVALCVVKCSAARISLLQS